MLYLNRGFLCIVVFHSFINESKGLEVQKFVSSKKQKLRRTLRFELLWCTELWSIPRRKRQREFDKHRISWISITHCQPCMKYTWKVGNAGKYDLHDSFRCITWIAISLLVSLFVEKFIDYERFLQRFMQYIAYIYCTHATFAGIVQTTAMFTRKREKQTREH